MDDDELIGIIVKDERSFDIPFNYIRQMLSILQDNNLINTETLKEKG